MDPTFFLKMIPMMDGGDDVGMVLSPQCFHNLNQEGDIFNHSNIHFWECASFSPVQPTSLGHLRVTRSRVHQIVHLPAFVVAGHGF